MLTRRIGRAAHGPPPEQLYFFDQGARGWYSNYENTRPCRAICCQRHTCISSTFPRESYGQVESLLILFFSPSLRASIVVSSCRLYFSLMRVGRETLDSHHSRVEAAFSTLLSSSWATRRSIAAFFPHSRAAREIMHFRRARQAVAGPRRRHVTIVPLKRNRML